MLNLSVRKRQTSVMLTWCDRVIWSACCTLLLLTIGARVVCGLPDDHTSEELASVGQALLHRIMRNNGTSGASSRGPDAELPRAHKKHAKKRHPLLFDWTTSCGECNPQLCEEIPVDCQSGLVRDACDCCYVCGNLEDTPCDLPGEPFRFGDCGKGLSCTPVELHDQGVGEADAYCACADSTVVCGTDGRTYSNPCKFRRASGRKRNLSKAHIGPCLAAPLVEIPPMNQTAETGSTAVFSCSVSGFPLAWFEWLKDGEDVFSPGKSDGIVVQMRNGPLQYQVTTWLEIERILPKHAGMYKCVAKNEHGITSASARLEIIPGESDDTNYYVYRGRSYNFHKALKGQAKAAETYKSSYLRGHTLYDDVADTQPLMQRQSSIKFDTDVESFQDYSDNSYVDVLDGTDEDRKNNDVDALLVGTLKNMAQPKGFKDIFFDDDELAEESGDSNI